jgi:hypothetical protein
VIADELAARRCSARRSAASTQARVDGGGERYALTCPLPSHPRWAPSAPRRGF